MLMRLALFIVLGILIARAFWRLVDGIAAGVRGAPPRGKGCLGVVAIVGLGGALLLYWLVRK